jgi:hypothetical protein
VDERERSALTLFEDQRKGIHATNFPWIRCGLEICYLPGKRATHALRADAQSGTASDHHAEQQHKTYAGHAGSLLW